ncbi:hypothetical protein [Rhodococcus indonesiensis]|uniref:hypothetical protein n=1 Tax=Rhodococcus indonesiensis TaxID=3055869 RepID=UPI0039F6C7C8
MPVLPRFARPRARSLGVALSLTTLLAGCGNSADGAAPASTATSTEVTVPVAAVTAVVLDPGAEPRSRIRLTPPAGTSQQVALTTSSQVFQSIGDQPEQDFSTPELTLPLTATVGEAVSDTSPSSLVDLRIDDATSPDAALAAALGPAEGSEAGLTMAPSGAVSALRLDPTPDSADIARSAIEQAFYQAVYRMVSFPEEEIGVGAVWEIHQQVMSGMALDQVATARLLERDGDRLTVQLRITQTPRESTWALPNGSGQLNIDRYEMTGEGTMTIDLGRPLPIAGDLTVGGKQAYSDPAGTTRLAQSLVDRVRWQS